MQKLAAVLIAVSINAFGMKQISVDKKKEAKRKAKIKNLSIVSFILYDESFYAVNPNWFKVFTHIVLNIKCF